jgi:hypothetical protein
LEDVTFDEYEVPLLFFFDYFGLEVDLLDIRMATPACFFRPFVGKLFSSLSFLGSFSLFP